MGLAHVYRAYTAQFMQEYATGEMSARQQRWARRLGSGLGSAGSHVRHHGRFFLYAGVSADPSEARGLGGALVAMAQQSYGPWLLGVVALGLVAYGLFCLSQAPTAAGRVPVECGYCFGTSPKPSERGQSAGHHHSKPIFKTLSMSLGLYLSTLSPSTPRSSTGILF